MSSLVFVFVFGLFIPGVVISQFHGLPRLDPFGENVCEYGRRFAAFTELYSDDLVLAQHRITSTSEESTEVKVDNNNGGVTSGAEYNGGKWNPTYIPDVWSSNPTNVIHGNPPIIQDFFEYRCCPGWEQRGNSCTHAICVKPCLHGKCTAPHTCTCRTGWTGSTCEKMCEPGDTSVNCGGSYLCDPISRDCTCLPGYTGNKCNLPCPVGTYGPGCKSRCKCTEAINENYTCDRYTGVCPQFGMNSAVNTGLPSIDSLSTAAPRTVVHEALSTMKIVFLVSVAVICLIAAVAGLIFHKRRRKASRNSDAFFKRKKSWGAMVITELNEVNDRRRKARHADTVHNTSEYSVYDNPPSPPSRRHTYLDSIMDTLNRTNYAGLRVPDGQEADTIIKMTPLNSAAAADVKPIVDIDSESIYEVHDCGDPAGAAAAAATYASHVTQNSPRLPKRSDSIYTNDSVFSIAANRYKGNNALLTPVANSIEPVESGSEYDYPYSDYADYVPPSIFVPTTNTEPRRQRRKRFGSRDRRLRKGSSDGQMYSVLIRPDIEAVSYKQSKSDGFDHPGYASRIEHIPRSYDHGYAHRIDSSTDLYSAQPDMEDSIYSRPCASPTSTTDGTFRLPVPDSDEAIYSRYSDDSNDTGNPFTLGYLTSVRKNTTVSPTSSNASNGSHFEDFHPPVPDHYQASNVLKRNLFRHQFQTVHEKTACISVKRQIRLARPNCLRNVSNYHDYVNGKVISKPALPRRQLPAMDPLRPPEDVPTVSLPLNANCPDINPESQCVSLPIPSPRTHFPCPDDLDSDNYLSLRFSEKTRPMKSANNI